MESIKLILRRISHLFYSARARLLNAYFQSVMLMLLDVGGMTDSLRHPDFICYKRKADVIFHPDSFVLSAVGASQSSQTDGPRSTRREKEGEIAL